jgi:hypothetical protein
LITFKLFLLKKSDLFFPFFVFHSFFWSRICADKIYIHCRSAMLLLVSLQKKNNPVRFWYLAILLVGNGPDSYLLWRRIWKFVMYILSKIAMSNICSKPFWIHELLVKFAVWMCTFWGYEALEGILSVSLIAELKHRYVCTNIWLSECACIFQSELSYTVCMECAYLVLPEP